jgi:ribose transport system substrate-binding protein
MVGEARAGYLQLWHDVLQERPDFTSYGVVNPPGVGADGVRVAMEILQGGTVDPDKLAGPFGNSLYVPIPYAVDAANFDRYYNEVAELPESYTLDGFISQAQAETFMVRDWSAVEPITIGVSNGFVGSEWRTQMIQNIEEVVAEFQAQGLAIELVVESADVDVQGQVQQVQNLINRGVDAIIINPNDQSGLNLALEDAVAEGIVVIAVDQEISAEGVYNVVIDQIEWARMSARWLAEQLGGEGDVVLIEGFIGHPANEARMQGVEEVFANYPGINVVGRDTGQWDQATGQQVMSDFLASLPNIDGVWTQDGMAQGALTAVRTANPDEWPVMVGEARAGYLQLWHDVLQERPDFTSFGVVNPPGVGADGVRVAVEILLGHTPDASKLAGPFGNSFYVPIPYVVDEFNFDQYYAEVAEQPESYTLDGFITQLEAAGFME